ncbi:hypothetical protein L7F22_045393 [Adiantum nelumboides]|nr:hypothetical protein [Adiantum nelumboides]
MAFPNFFGKQYESASNFLDDLEMAFLVSGRDEEEVKLRAFPLVLKDSAKNWFQNLEPGKKTNWETLKETFLSKYGGLDNPKHLWHRISSLHQATSRTYLTYESQFLRLWAEWEASLAEGERAPNFLKKEKFLAGLFPDLQEKVKGKFPETFEEALQIARVKDRKLEYQAHTSRVEHPQGPTMADERLPPAPTTTPEDPHLELLQRVTNQLDNLSINMVQGVRQQQPQPNNERMPNGPRRQPQRRDYFCYNCGEEGHGMYFCPHPRNFNAQAGRGRQQVTPPRARPPPQIQHQILQNPQMVAQPQVLQRSVSPQPVAEIPPLPNNNVERGPSEHPSARRITIRLALELINKPYDLPISSNVSRLTIQLADGCSKDPCCVFSALNCVKLQCGPFEHPLASRITIRLALKLAGRPYDFPASSNASRITKRFADGCLKGPCCVFSALDCVKLQRGPFEHPSASRITIRFALELAGKPYDLPANSNARQLTIQLADGCSEGPRYVISALYCVKLQHAPYEHPSASRITIRLAFKLVGKPYDLLASSNANRITKRLADECSKGPRCVFSALDCVKLQRGPSEYPSASRITIRLVLQLAGKPYDLPASSHASRLTIRLDDGCLEGSRCIFSVLNCIKLQRGSSEHPSASHIIKACRQVI